MKRMKKTIRNLILIAILVVLWMYFNGYYISKEQCVLETARGLYATGDIVMELNYDINTSQTENGKKYSFTVLSDEEKGTCSIIGTKKVGFLYKPYHSSVNHIINDENIVDFLSYYTTEAGEIVVVHRNDKKVERINFEKEDGTFMILDEWKGDFVGFVGEQSDMLYESAYQVCDKNGNLLEKN